MEEDPRRPILRELSEMRASFRQGWQLLRQRGPSQIQFWFIALLVGSAAGGAAVLFRFGITELQSLAYGTEDLHMLHSFAETLDWWWVLTVPVLGGLAVGVLLHLFTPDGRVRSVADVIEGAALNDGRVERRAGRTSALCSLITLSTGGSTGREGPVVHIAALISTAVSNAIRADGITGRDLLGCAVAAAVSASSTRRSPGALFAMEVILRHFALHAFAPIVIASAAGTVIGRLAFGDVTNFVLPGGSALEFYIEMPAFLLLGLVCGFVGVMTMRAIFLGEDVGTRLQRAPGCRSGCARPARALLGGIAIFFPHIIGVGYETTTAALTGQLLLHEAIAFTIVKVIAVAVTMGGRMGGGVFSPSLMLGALTGLAFGIVATGIFPEVSGSPTLYALAGDGGGGRGGAGGADLHHAHRVRTDRRLADGPRGDGLRLDVHRACLAAGGPLLLPHPARAAGRAPRRRPAGISAADVPRGRRDAGAARRSGGRRRSLLGACPERRLRGRQRHARRGDADLREIGPALHSRGDAARARARRPSFRARSFTWMRSGPTTGRSPPRRRKSIPERGVTGASAAARVGAAQGRPPGLRAGLQGEGERDAARAGAAYRRSTVTMSDS